MLFVAIILGVAGYNLIYAGVKGDHYTIGGTPVWRAPWLPIVNVFTSHPAPVGDSFAAGPAALGAAGAFAGAAAAGGIRRPRPSGVAQAEAAAAQAAAWLVP